MQKGDVLAQIAHETVKARQEHPSFINASHAAGVIREEYLEWEDEAFTKVINKAAARKELIQLAAACVNAIIDLDL